MCTLHTCTSLLRIAYEVKHIKHCLLLRHFRTDVTVNTLNTYHVTFSVHGFFYKDVLSFYMILVLYSMLVDATCI